MIRLDGFFFFFLHDQTNLLSNEKNKKLVTEGKNLLQTEKHLRETHEQRKVENTVRKHWDVNISRNQSAQIRVREQDQRNSRGTDETTHRQTWEAQSHHGKIEKRPIQLEKAQTSRETIGEQGIWLEKSPYDFMKSPYDFEKAHTILRKAHTKRANKWRKHA